eukprot:1583403-Prymnesium_polylepis.1
MAVLDSAFRRRVRFSRWRAMGRVGRCCAVYHLAASVSDSLLGAVRRDTYALGLQCLHDRVRQYAWGVGTRHCVCSLSSPSLLRYTHLTEQRKSQLTLNGGALHQALSARAIAAGRQSIENEGTPGSAPSCSRGGTRGGVRVARVQAARLVVRAVYPYSPVERVQVSSTAARLVGRVRADAGWRRLALAGGLVGGLASTPLGITHR